MTAQSISAVVQQAVEGTGMEQVAVQDRTRHHGSGYLARAFEDYLRMLAGRHICCYYSPHHPQSNGKLERFHERLNARVNLLVYTGPDQLRAAMAEFIDQRVTATQSVTGLSARLRTRITGGSTSFQTRARCGPGATRSLGRVRAVARFQS